MKKIPSIEELKILAQGCGEMIVADFKLGMEKEIKDDNTPVTPTDKRINKMVLDYFKREYPHISVVSEEAKEEEGIIEGAELVAYCDPLDGTFPFAHGIPLSTFVLAIVKNGEPMLAVIYDPFIKRLFYAEKDKGAYLQIGSQEPEAIKVSNHPTIKDAHACFIWWKHVFNANIHHVCYKWLDAGGHYINPVSISYMGALVACGEYHASVFPGQNPWDSVAIDLIATESGGKVSDMGGKKIFYNGKDKINGHIVSNPILHKEVLEMVRSCQKQ